MGGILFLVCLVTVFVANSALRIAPKTVEPQELYRNAEDDVNSGLVDQLYKMSQIEEGLNVTHWPERPFLLMWPRSLVKQIAVTTARVGKKTRKFNFIGNSWSGNVRGKHRAWMLQFAKQRFQQNDFYVDTGAGRGHKAIGAYDHTREWKAIGKNVDHYPNGQVPYDEPYFTKLVESEFTLCPAGDQPYTYRFAEALFSKSIPIVEKDEHANAEKRNYGVAMKYTPQILFHYYILNEDPNFEYVYNETWAEENLQKVKQHHTLMKEYGGSIDSRGFRR